MSSGKASIIPMTGGLDQLRMLAMGLHAYLIANYAFSPFRPPPVLVYQMGKVASSTVCASLKASGLRNSVLHLHFLSRDLPNHIETHKRAGIHNIPYHLMLSKAVREILLRSEDRLCKVITLVRDPIAFVVSDIFQNPKFAKENIERTDGTISVEKVNDYLRRELSEPDAIGYPDGWFDRELKRVFGIDVFAEPFPKDLGFEVYKGKRVEVLLLRVEDLSSKGAEAISRFLGIRRPIDLKQCNVRNSSNDSRQYESLLNTFSIDESMCRAIYSCRLVKHFYSEEMIDLFVSRWTKARA